MGPGPLQQGLVVLPLSACRPDVPEQVGKKYYLPGTVVPEEKQWEVISAYLQEAGFAYCQDVAELLHVGKRKTAGILRRMVRDGQLLQFEKRYYLAKQPGQKQIQ